MIKNSIFHGQIAQLRVTEKHMRYLKITTNLTDTLKLIKLDHNRNHNRILKKILLLIAFSLNL